MIIFGKTPEDYKRLVKKTFIKKWKLLLAFLLLLLLGSIFS